jgi:hypothetical protein
MSNESSDNSLEISMESLRSNEEMINWVDGSVYSENIMSFEVNVIY